MTPLLRTKNLSACYSEIKGGRVINGCGSHTSVPGRPVLALHVPFKMQFPLNGHRAVLLPDMTAFTTSSALMILCHRNNRNMTFNCDYSLCESILENRFCRGHENVESWCLFISQKAEPGTLTPQSPPWTFHDFLK